MKVRLIHIIPLFLLVLFACKQEKKTDWRVTYDRNKKDPYGCHIAYHHLSSIFPSANIKAGSQIMRQINKTLLEKSYNQSGHVVIVVCRSFEVDSAEFEKLMQFVKLDNAVCIFSERYSNNIYNYFTLKDNFKQNRVDTTYYKEDSIPNQPLTMLFDDTLHDFKFTGRAVHQYFERDSVFNDSNIDLGYTDDPNHSNTFIHYENNGALLINKAPITMTNYFMLQDSNRRYFEYVLSHFNEYPTSVTWYSFLSKYESENSEIDWSSLFKQPAIFYAFLLMLIVLLLYVIFAAKRQQRIIPIQNPMENTSLEFVETVGKLYYSKKDNPNLVEKMIVHYLENIRSKYAIRTQELNNEFANHLSHKINRSSEETNAFVSYLNYIRGSNQVTDIDIQHLYQQLKKFS